MSEMNLYSIRRRSGWKNSDELAKAAGVSARIGNEEMPDKVRWIRSYVVAEEDGSLGTVCLYEATGPDAIREHAARVGMPADEIVEVADTVVIRADPQAA
jgi:hypothetical protein